MVVPVHDVQWRVMGRYHDEVQVPCRRAPRQATFGPGKSARRDRLPRRFVNLSLFGSTVPVDRELPIGLHGRAGLMQGDPSMRHCDSSMRHDATRGRTREPVHPSTPHSSSGWIGRVGNQEKARLSIARSQELNCRRLNGKPHFHASLSQIVAGRSLSLIELSHCVSKVCQHDAGVAR